jgi:hypothetical protein
VVETDKVVHVGVGNKNAFNFEELPGRQGMDVTKVEHQGLPSEFKLDINPRITEGGVNQIGIEHGGSHRGALSKRLRISFPSYLTLS